MTAHHICLNHSKSITSSLTHKKKKKKNLLNNVKVFIHSIYGSLKS